MKTSYSNNKCTRKECDSWEKGECLSLNETYEDCSKCPFFKERNENMEHRAYMRGDFQLDSVEEYYKLAEKKE